MKYARDPQLVRKYTEACVRSYLAALDLVVISTFQPKEEDEMWNRLAPIRQWLERERLLEDSNADADASMPGQIPPFAET